MGIAGWVSRAVRHPFLGDSVVFFVLSSLINVLNYGFVLLAGRSLSKADFGTFNALLGCVTLSTVVAHSLELTVTRAVATRSPTRARRYQYGLIRRVAIWAAAIAIPVGLAAPGGAHLLSARPSDLLMAYATVVALVFASLANGVTAGLRRMKLQGVLNLVGTGLKLAAGGALFAVGVGVSGALGAYGLGFWCVFALTMFCASPDVRTARVEAEPSHDDARPHRVFLVYLLVVLPFMLDQLIVQIVNQPLSGDYAALSTLGKVVFFGSAPLTTVLFPYMASQQDDSARLGYFLAGSALTLTLASAGVVVLWIGAETLAPRIFSAAYGNIGTYVGTFATGVLIYVASYLIVQLSLARGGRYPVVPLAVTVVVQVALFSWRHDGLGALVTNQLSTYAVQLVLLLPYVFGARPVQSRPMVR